MSQSQSDVSVGDDDNTHAAVCQKCCEKKQDKVFLKTKKCLKRYI